MAQSDHPHQSQILFGTNLRRLRAQRQLSQEGLAEQAGLSPSFVSELELARKWISADVLDRLSQALAVDIYELFLPAVADRPQGDQALIERYMSRVDQQVREEVADILGRVRRETFGEPRADRGASGASPREERGTEPESR